MAKENADRSVNPPKQRRSEATVKRILETAAALFAEHRTTEVSIAEICVRAEVSRSSLYARFRDHDAIVHSVYDAFCARALEVSRRMDRDFEGLRESGAGADELVNLSVEIHRVFYHAENGLVQAIRYREAHDPVLRGKRESLDRQLLEGALAVFLRHFPEFAETDFVHRIDASMPMLVAVFRSFFDFPDQLDAIDDDALERIGVGLASMLRTQVDSASGAIEAVGK